MKNKIINAVFTLSASVGVAIMAATAQAETTGEIVAIEDASFLDIADTRYIPNNDLSSELDTSGDGSVWLSLLKFDLSSLDGAYINNAYLQLTVALHHDPTVAGYHDVFSSGDDSWSEYTVNGANRPADSGLSLQDTQRIAAQNQPYEAIYYWDIYDAVMGVDGLGGDNDFLTLMVSPNEALSPDEMFGVHFRDRTDAGWATPPKLMVNISPVPEAPAAWLLCAGLGLLSVWTRFRKRIKRLA